MIRIIIGFSFLNYLLLFQLVPQTVFTNDLPCHKWIVNNIINVSDQHRPDVYNITTAEQNPFAVLVVCRIRSGKHEICSGTLLSQYWVLTASHCFVGCKPIFVYAGGNDMLEIYKTDRPRGSQLRRGSKVCKHKLFDVTLVKVRIGFSLSRYVNTIRLPTGPLPSAIIPCVFTAFGKILDSDKERRLDFVRKTQELKVVHPCACYYRDWKPSKGVWNLAANGSNFVCSVPREDYGACSGDSGSGLVCKGELHGVTSSIYSRDDLEACIFKSPFTRQPVCGSKDTTSIFVSVYPLLDWIKNVTSNENVEKTDCYDAGKSTVVFVSSGLLVITWVLVWQYSNLMTTNSLF